MDIEQKVTTHRVAKELGISRRLFERFAEQPDSPRPYEIAGRKLWLVSECRDAMEKSRQKGKS